MCNITASHRSVTGPDMVTCGECREPEPKLLLRDSLDSSDDTAVEPNFSSSTTPLGSLLDSEFNTLSYLNIEIYISFRIEWLFAKFPISTFTLDILKSSFGWSYLMGIVVRITLVCNSSNMLFCNFSMMRMQPNFSRSRTVNLTPR